MKERGYYPKNVGVEIKSAQIKKTLAEGMQPISILRISRSIDDMVTAFKEQDPKIGTYDLYKKVTDKLPGKIPEEADDLVLKVARLGGPHAKKLLVFFNMQTLLGVVDHYFDEEIDDISERDNMAQIAVSGLLEKISTKQLVNLKFSQTVHHGASLAIRSYLEERDGVPFKLTEVSEYKEIRRMVANAVEGKRAPLTAFELEELTERILGLASGISKKEIKEYITVRSFQKDIESIPEEKVKSEEDVVFNQVSSVMAQKEINRRLERIDPRDAEVVKLHYGVYGQEPHSLEEIGVILGISGGRVAQIEPRALWDIRDDVRQDLYKKCVKDLKNKVFKVKGGHIGQEISFKRRERRVLKNAINSVVMESNGRVLKELSDPWERIALEYEVFGAVSGLEDKAKLVNMGKSEISAKAFLARERLFCALPENQDKLR